MPINAVSAVQLPNKIRTSRAVVHGRRIFPSGFARAGGDRLPPKQREEALREIEAVTTGMNPAQRFATIQKIVFNKWREAVSQPSDITQLSYGRSSVPTYTDPDAGEQARRMLLWIPTTPEFAGILEPIEATVWSMYFSGDTQDTIASAIGKSQSEVSKTLKQAVKQLNSHYRQLRDQDALPFAIAAWVKQVAEDDARHTANPDLADAVERLRKRGWILQARKHDVGPVAACNPRDAKTGDPELDALSIRKA